MDTREKIGRARFDFLIDHPFLGDLSLRLLVKKSESVSTMGTDMKNLYYNDKYVESISEDHLRGVLAHEIIHCILSHAGKEGRRRRGDRNWEIWEIACEFMTNYCVV